MPVDRERLRLGVQLLGTVALSAAPIPGAWKALGLLLGWALSLERLGRADLLLFLAANAIFFPLNVATVRGGLFTFQHPDVLGVPFHECFLWGFWLVHARRMVCRATAPRPDLWFWGLLAAFAAAFLVARNPETLLAATSAVVLAALLRFREAEDRRCALYMGLVGALVEYTGVWSGQWSYPGNPAGGVPLWFIPLWCGVGLFVPRLTPLFPDRAASRHPLPEVTT